MKFEQIAGLVTIVLLIGLAQFVWAYKGTLLVLTVLAVVGWLIYRAMNPYVSPKERQLKKLKEEYDRVLNLVPETDWKEVSIDLMCSILKDRTEEPLIKLIASGINDLSFSIRYFPEFHNDMNLEEVVNLRAFLEEKERFYSRGYLEKWKFAVSELYEGIVDRIPPVSGDALFDSRAIDSIPVAKMVDHIYSEIISQPELFPDLSKTLSRIYEELQERPSESKLPPQKLVDAYLKDLPNFRNLFFLNTGFSIPLSARLEHQVIVGGSGAGKTQLLQYLLTKEKGGFCVIDSQGDMIHKLAERFDDVILIDPEDIDYPLALNMFDVKLGGEEVLNATVSLYEYIFGALLGAELTQRQSLIFGYLVKLMLVIPNATIHTMIDLMENGEKYVPYMNKLDSTAQNFFKGMFFDKQFIQTKKQILTRLHGVLSNTTFDRIFSSPVNKIDLFTAMNSGQRVLINTSKKFFQAERSAIFGRFFIAMLMQAAIRRVVIPEAQRKPFFLYIDEAAEYFDDHLEEMLNQARKYKVGIVFAVQNLGQMPPNLKATMMSSTSIKMAAGVSAADAHSLALEMGCDREDIRSCRKYEDHSEWMCFVRNLGTRKVTCQFGVLENMPAKEKTEYGQFIEKNRALLSVPKLEEPVAKEAETEQKITTETNSYPTKTRDDDWG